MSLLPLLTQLLLSAPGPLFPHMSHFDGFVLCQSNYYAVPFPECPLTICLQHKEYYYEE